MRRVTYVKFHHLVTCWVSGNTMIEYDHDTYGPPIRRYVHDGGIWFLVK